MSGGGGSPSGFRSPTPLLRGTVRLGHRNSLAADLDDLAAVASPGGVAFYASELPGGQGGGSEGNGSGLVSPLLSPASARPSTGLRGKRRGGIPTPAPVQLLVDDGDEEDLLHQVRSSCMLLAAYLLKSSWTILIIMMFPHFSLATCV